MEIIKGEGLRGAKREGEIRYALRFSSGLPGWTHCTASNAWKERPRE
jgi:hypothetical protein